MSTFELTPSALILSPALADLFGAEGADAVEAEGEDDAVLFAQSDVETRKLNRRRATIPCVSERHCRTDQRTIPSSGSLLKIEEERRTAKEPTIAIAQKYRWTPLRTAHRSRFKSPRISQRRKVRSQLDRARVIKTLKHLDARSGKSEGR